MAPGSGLYKSDLFRILAPAKSALARPLSWKATHEAIDGAESLTRLRAPQAYPGPEFPSPELERKWSRPGEQ